MHVSADETCLCRHARMRHLHPIIGIRLCGANAHHPPTGTPSPSAEERTLVRGSINRGGLKREACVFQYVWLPVVLL